MKPRGLGEKSARDIGLREHIYFDERAKQMDILEELEERRLLDVPIASHLHRIRQKGNQATHEHNASKPDAIAGLQFAYEILKWYAKEYLAPETATKNYSRSYFTSKREPLSQAKEPAFPSADSAPPVFEPE